MLSIHHIPGWTCRRRRRFLDRFREDMEAYFADVTHEAFPYRLVEGESAREIREGLEPRLERCRRTVQAAGVGTLTRQAPGERTGEVVRVNLVAAAFELARYNLTPGEVFKVLDQARERYRSEEARAWLRTVNPLYWLEMLLGTVEILALQPVRLFGGDPRAAARTPLGVNVRLAVRVGALLLLAWAAVVMLGLEGPLVAWVQGFFATGP